MRSGYILTVVWLFLIAGSPARPSPAHAQSDPPPASDGPGAGQETGTVVDVDGNVYRTVRIGDQWWMAENLQVTRDPAGNPIESRVYNDDDALLEVYGRLYRWGVAMHGSEAPGARGIAPEGWRIPSRGDWETLFRYLGGVERAGGILKEVGTAHWDAPNAGASDGVGFAGVPGGGFSGRLFEGLGIGGHYWSSTGADTEAEAPTLHRDYEEVLRIMVPKSYFVSVRCVRDAVRGESG